MNKDKSIWLSITLAIIVIVGIIIWSVRQEMSEAFLIFIGAIIGTIGGVTGQLIEALLRRKNRRSEILAEREIDACAWAYSVLKKVIMYTDPGTPNLNNFEEAKKIVDENNSLFWGKIFFLPGESFQFWLDCRNYVWAKQWEKAKDSANRALIEMHKALEVKIPE